MIVGQFENYYYLQTPLLKLSEFVTLFPEAFLSHYIVVVAQDGEVPTKTKLKVSQDWKFENKVAYSPLIKKTVGLPASHYDEWYVFEEMKKMSAPLRFVNDGISLLSPEEALAGSNEELPKEVLKEFVDGLYQLQKDFWETIRKISPLIYLSDGEHFTLVTQDQSLVEKLSQEIS